MEIEIVGDSIAEAVMDLEKFKKILGKDWNLEEAVKKSIRVVKIETEKKDVDEFVQFVFLGLNWGELIDSFQKFKDKEMRIKCYAVKFKNWKRFRPGTIVNKRKYIIDEEDVKEGDDVILIQSLIKGVNFNIKNFIDNSQFRYGFDRWGVEVDFVRDKK